MRSLRSRQLDVLIGDTAILDYFRANDPGCNLNLLGDSIFDDAYAVAMQKGFPLKVISHATRVSPSNARPLPPCHVREYSRQSPT